jgi:hypothetical protein
MIPLLATSSSPFLDSLRDDLGLDHCEATGACKSEIGKKGGVAAGVFAAGVKQIIRT